MDVKLIISAVPGSGSRGCEVNNECFLPYEVTVAAGSTITWSNDDVAAHTVTSGSQTSGETGVFDSGLFMSESIFEYTFNEVGIYDYYCKVHPWMEGIVHVN